MKVIMGASLFERIDSAGVCVEGIVGSRTAAHEEAAAFRTLEALELELTLNQERDDDREQRDSFDERREDDRARLNALGHLRLTRHSIHCLPSETSDTDAGADYGETRADAGTEQAPRARVLTGVRGSSLKQRKHVYHFFFPFIQS
jgi:hypothetical protein